MFDGFPIENSQRSQHSSALLNLKYTEIQIDSSIEPEPPTAFMIERTNFNSKDLLATLEVTKRKKDGDDDAINAISVKKQRLGTDIKLNTVVVTGEILILPFFVNLLASLFVTMRVIRGGQGLHYNLYTRTSDIKMLCIPLVHLLPYILWRRYSVTDFGGDFGCGFSEPIFIAVSPETILDNLSISR